MDDESRQLDSIGICTRTHYTPIIRVFAFGFLFSCQLRLGHLANSAQKSHTRPEHTDTSPQVSQRSELSHSAAAGAAGSCRPACTCQPTTAERRAQRTAQLQYPRGKGVISPRHGSDKPGPGRPDPQSRLRVIVQIFSCTRLAVLLPRVRTRAVREAKGKYKQARSIAAQARRRRLGRFGVDAPCPSPVWLWRTPDGSAQGPAGA